MMMAFTTHHSRGTFRFFNNETMKIIHSRDFFWMNSMYGQFFSEMDNKTTKEIIFKTEMEIFELPNSSPVEQKEVKILDFGHKNFYSGRTQSQT